MEEQYRYCPQENDTWCKFCYDKCHNTTKEITGFHLYSFMNSNPYLGGLVMKLLWAHCPKNKCSGFRKIELAVCQTICKFNTGTASRLPILEAVGVKP